MTEQAASAAGSTDAARAWHGMTVEEALAAQGVDAANGLSDAEVEARRAKFGSNKFAEAEKEPRLRAFLRQYRDPMQIVLLVAGIVSMFLPGQFATGVVLVFLTLLNAFLGLSQEGKAEASVAALQKMMIVQAKVRRGGEVRQIPMEELVPGDIVNIEAGDLVPADGRIIRAATLEIDESALTGESAPVPKSIDAVKADAALGDRVDMAFMNTQVTRGAATFVVTSTGMGTEVGHISDMLQQTTAEVTPLTKQLNTLTNQILVIAGVALVISIGLGLYRDQPFQLLFLTAVAFSVSAIPTGLPAVVTTILANGTSTLAKAGAIVKRLRSVETLGSTSAINSDKTGTLTLNQMTAVQMAIAGQRFSISGEGYSTVGNIQGEAGRGEVPLERYLLPMALCADAVAKDGAAGRRPDRGRARRARRQGRRRPGAHPREVPADRRGPVRRRVQVHGHVPRDAGRGRQAGHPGYVKGAPDQLLARAANAIRPDGGTAPIADVREPYLAENERLGSQGLRVMATGYRDFDPATFDRTAADQLPLVQDLTLLALVGIVDPPRPEAKRRDRDRPRGRHPGPDDHRRPRRDRRGDRPPAGHHRAGDHGRRVRRHGRRHAAPRDRRHRRHRARRAGGQGPPRRHPQAQGPHRRHDRRRRERRARAQEGRHRRRDGHHRHRGLEGGRGDDPHRRQLRDHRQGGRARPGAVRQPGALHPVPDGGPVRVHRARSSARAILFIAQGMPFLPLQTLWVNFTVQVFLAIGLGYGKAREGLMKDAPRSPTVPILGTRLLVYLVFIGVVISALTLARHRVGDAGVRRDASPGRWASRRSRSPTSGSRSRPSDEDASMFSAKVLGNAMLLKTAGLALVATVVMSELGLLNRILDTVNLTIDQWLIAFVVSLAVIVVAEVKKLLKIQTAEIPPLAAVPADAAPAAPAAA